jgi:hypothetical protein
MWKESGINNLFDCKVESFDVGWWRCGWIGVASFIGRMSWKIVKSQGRA